MTVDRLEDSRLQLRLTPDQYRRARMLQIRASCRPVRSRIADPTEPRAAELRDQFEALLLQLRPRTFVIWLYDNHERSSSSGTANHLLGVAQLYQYLLEGAATLDESRNLFHHALAIWDSAESNGADVRLIAGLAAATCTNLAFVERLAGDLVRAWKWTHRALELDPASGAAWVNALCLASLAKDDERLRGLVQGAFLSYPSWTADPVVREAFDIDVELHYLRTTPLWDELTRGLSDRSRDREISSCVELPRPSSGETGTQIFPSKNAAPHVQQPQGARDELPGHGQPEGRYA